MEATILECEHSVAYLTPVNGCHSVSNDTGTGNLTSAISSAVTSSLNSNITIWMIPILELVREGRKGLKMLKGKLMKLNRAMKASPMRMKSVSFDRTLRWRFIVRGV